MAGTQAKEKQLEHAEAQRRAAKADLLRPQLVSEEVVLDSLGMTVKIKSLTQRARDEIRRECGYGTENWDESKAMLLQIIYCVEEPKLTLEDMDSLLDQSAEIVDELSMHISLLNMMGRAGDLKKESKKTENSDSA